MSQCAQQQLNWIFKKPKDSHLNYNLVQFQLHKLRTCSLKDCY